VRSRNRTHPPAAPHAEGGSGASPDLLDGVDRVAGPRVAQAPVSELRFGQLGIAQLGLRSADPAALHAELEAKIIAAPQLFTRAPVVVDLGSLDPLPSAQALRGLLDAVRAAGLLPVGLSHGSAGVAELADALELPQFAKFRAVEPGVERAPAVAAVPAVAPELPASRPRSAPAIVGTAPISAVGMHHAAPVRSGQQVYARGRDLTLTAMVGNGAEVIADGSIHVYGVLRGRALAGASGDGTARIFCHNFQAELISIAGQYRVFEDMPVELRGKPVQAWLEGDKLRLAVLA